MSEVDNGMITIPQDSARMRAIKTLGALACQWIAENEPPDHHSSLFEAVVESIAILGGDIDS